MHITTKFNHTQHTHPTHRPVFHFSHNGHQRKKHTNTHTQRKRYEREDNWNEQTGTVMISYHTYIPQQRSMEEGAFTTQNIAKAKQKVFLSHSTQQHSTQHTYIQTKQVNWRLVNGTKIPMPIQSLVRKNKYIINHFNFTYFVHLQPLLNYHCVRCVIQLEK